MDATEGHVLRGLYATLKNDADWASDYIARLERDLAALDKFLTSRGY